jgi:hypothetical protein
MFSSWVPKESHTSITRVNYHFLMTLMVKKIKDNIELSYNEHVGGLVKFHD